MHLTLEQLLSSEDFNLVADFCINIGDIDHAGVHANIADDRCPFPSHEHFSDSVAQVAVQAVRIADRNDGNAGGTEGVAFAAVADGLSLRDIPNGHDVRLEAADRAQRGVGCTDAVQTDSEPHHVEMVAGEPLDSRLRE